MTVHELINILQQLDPNLPVVMSMNQEYECPITPGMVIDFTDNEGNREVRIDNAFE